jgi:hypothetical protein
MRKCERQGCEKVLPIDREKLLGSVALVVGHPLTLARRCENEARTFDAASDVFRPYLTPGQCRCVTQQTQKRRPKARSLDHRGGRAKWMASKIRCQVAGAKGDGARRGAATSL